jgi:hypothetical protein
LVLFGIFRTYFIHQTENDFFVALETPSQLAPEFAKLGCCGRFHIRRISYDAASHWLLRGIVVPHIVVRIQDSISAFLLSNIVDSRFKFREVLLDIKL